MKTQWLLLALSTVVATPGWASPHDADAVDAKPLQHRARVRTAALKTITYDARASKYVIKATIALSNVQGTRQEREARSLEAKITYLRSGESRTSSASAKLSEITIVSQDAEKGIAIVQIKVSGARADNLDAATVRLDVVGANPTPHP